MSYPTFPPPLRVSYSIQIPKAIRLKFIKMKGAFKPPLPSARAVYVRTRPQRGPHQTRVFFMSLCLACAQSVGVAGVELEFKTITRRTTNRDC